MHSAQSSRLHLGIDTGGTFTDGVLLDLSTQTIVRKAKILTTHNDLTLCISAVLKELLTGQSHPIERVSLSTTLATNAIAEGKRRTVALLLLGYDPELVHKYHFDREFATRHFFFIDGRHGMDGKEQIALDEEAIIQAVNRVKDQVQAFAVASYAAPSNPIHEERTAEIIRGISQLPVVQAHHLSSELDSIRRAITASLNASLLSHLDDFLAAIEEMLAQYDLHCPVMMVRGDGSIVKAAYARQRPVEIIHSGPATSAVGGQFLAGADTGLVIDMGGTTTDIALISQGIALIQPGAATVGSYRTCVKTIRARSIGLGGDSLIHFDSHCNLSIGPERVLPLAHLCSEFPGVREELVDTLRANPVVRTSRALEYWILQREPANPFKNAHTNQVIALLNQGPKAMRKLLKQVGVVSPYQVDMDDLVNQEIILRANLTPSDLLHTIGEFTPWDVEVAALAVSLVARHFQQDVESFVRHIKNQITQKIIMEIIEYLSEQDISGVGGAIKPNNLDRWLIEESIEPTHAYLGCKLFLKIPIIGIGAPAKAFLPQVAQSLGCPIIFPPHFEVANAVGAAVSKIISRKEADVFPCLEGSIITGYFARMDGSLQKFEKFETAMAYARQQLSSEIIFTAQESGGYANHVNIDEKIIMDGMAHLSGWGIG